MTQNMSDRYAAIREVCRLDDIQTFHIAALECLDVALVRLRQKAMTAEDVAIIGEVRAARKYVQQAWRLVTEKHPQGVNHHD